MKKFFAAFYLVNVLSPCLFGQGVFDVLHFNACWNAPGKPTSVVRFYLVNLEGVQELQTYTATGAVNIPADQSVTAGFCECDKVPGLHTKEAYSPFDLLGIQTKPICWNGDSTVIRVYLQNPYGVIQLDDMDVNGNSVNVSGGTIETGYCTCN